eukprot:CAMPEP_0113307482 /NCGR_PEP_ID=MMETSP0010_2-20120614/6307_1 /TAXON_ID=216773 ORGANISM="Corethron hystrix, Strain 308" /NCGR_SAMPLE_ID=MMETSP0010_2 /ASSEMBLY_ACC=CAM_ASM_000155 /LENGTH=455 /DNA_ID=CAMNT_0000162341 /DNA_START=226 /DNA_END=1593 /DNA_ORIENTATION=+ /assembly_acc=CAM_ASM_000155
MKTTPTKMPTSTLTRIAILAISSISIDGKGLPFRHSAGTNIHFSDTWVAMLPPPSRTACVLWGSPLYNRNERRRTALAVSTMVLRGGSSGISAFALENGENEEETVTEVGMDEESITVDDDENEDDDDDDDDSEGDVLIEGDDDGSDYDTEDEYDDDDDAEVEDDLSDKEYDDSEESDVETESEEEEEKEENKDVGKKKYVKKNSSSKRKSKDSNVTAHRNGTQKPVPANPLHQMAVTVYVFFILRKIDLTNANVIIRARWIYLGYLVAVQLFVLYVRFRAKQVNNLHPIVIENPLADLVKNKLVPKGVDSSSSDSSDQQQGQQADVVKNLASRFLSTPSTVRDYDVSQAYSLRNSTLLPMLFNWFLHFKLGQVQPLVFQAASGAFALVNHPLFQVYVLGRDLERPFAAPASPIMANLEKLKQEQAEKEQEQAEKEQEQAEEEDSTAAPLIEEEE